MDEEGLIFKVYQKDGITKIENHTDNKLFLYVKPVKPKRKYTKAVLISPQSFKIFDSHMPIDLTKMMFSLEKE